MSQHFQAGVGPVWSDSGGIFFQLFAWLYCRCWLTAACLPRLRGWKSSAVVWVQLGRGVALSSLVVPLLQALGGEEPACLHVLKFLVKDAAGTSRGRADRSIQSLVCNHSIVGEDLGLCEHCSVCPSTCLNPACSWAGAKGGVWFLTSPLGQCHLELGQVLKGPSVTWYCHCSPNFILAWALHRWDGHHWHPWPHAGLPHPSRAAPTHPCSCTEGPFKGAVGTWSLPWVSGRCSWWGAGAALAGMEGIGCAVAMMHSISQGWQLRCVCDLTCLLK